MASINKRNGGYQVKWRDPDGKQRARTAPTRKSAEELEREVEECVARGRRWEPRDAREVPDLRTVMEQYLRHVARRGCASATLLRYGQFLEELRRWLLVRNGARASLPCTLLSRRLLEEHHDWLRENGRHESGRSSETARKHIEGVQLFWKWAHEWDEDGEACVPTPRRLELSRKPSQPPKAPRWDEMDACIDAASGWIRHLAVVLRFTGLRVQQAMMLRWTDFDLDGATLQIRGELGKSPAERTGRVVPVSRYLVRELRTWDTSSEFVITSPRKSRLARSRDMERAWRQSGVRAEVWASIPGREQVKSHHAFRYGFVSGLKRLGADAESVEFLVGHRVAGVRAAYLDSSSLPTREAVDVIPDLAHPTPGLRLVG